MEPLAAPDPASACPSDGLAPELEGLIERFRGGLCGLLRAWGAQDPIGLAQDVFAEVWLSRARFRGEWTDDAAVGPWLRGIALNLHRAERRRGARRGLSLDEAPEPEERRTDQRASEQRARIRAAVDALPEDQRTVVRMHYLERTPQAVMAALLGVTVKTVEGRLYRARRELARVLGECGERDPEGEVTR